MSTDYLPKQWHSSLVLEKQTLISATPFPAPELWGKNMLNIPHVH